MLSPFIINNSPLSLERFPSNQVNRSLQAWDASDEYLINYAQQEQLIKPNSNILVFNDSFGAISLNFLNNPTFSVNDSFVSQQGLLQNLKKNQLNRQNLTLLSSLDDLPTDIDVIFYKIPKNKTLLAEQLIAIKNTLRSNVVFIAADKAKNIQSATLKIFEKYLGTTTTSLAVKKSRLVFCQLNSSNKFSLPLINRWPLESNQLNISNRANVFSRDKLDIGARFFLEHLPTLRGNQSVIDLGCGNGVIGLSLLKKHPEIALSFVDESYMAIASAKDNVSDNLPHLLKQCQFQVNDCLSNLAAQSVDVILCNPPFHQQNATTDHIAWQMFKDSYKALKKGGELRIIGNRQLGYHIKLKRIFANETLIASNKKFVILSAIKL